jgi:dihydrofolate reductase
MSLDGCLAGPNLSRERPFGDGPNPLDGWFLQTRTFRAQIGEEGGETGPSDDVAAESMVGIGAYILGRNMFGGGPGPWGEHPQWGDEPWRGWWGPNPPYHTPVFVLTHHPRDPLEMEGGTTFHFVTDGIESALRQARDAAGGKDVRIGGGASVASQYLAAGLVDELEVHISPTLIGGGARLFQSFHGGDDEKRPALELIRTVTGPEVTHLKYRVLNH